MKQTSTIVSTPANKKEIVFIALGSNLGDREANLLTARKKIAEFTTISKKSKIYETEPVYYRYQGKFLNQVIAINCSLEPEILLNKLQEIEKIMGREKKINKGPRNIDLDIIYFGKRIIKEKNLQIPHAGVQERKFVLEPLAEIAPNFQDPIQKKSVKTMLKNVD